MLCYKKNLFSPPVSAWYIFSVYASCGKFTHSGVEGVTVMWIIAWAFVHLLSCTSKLTVAKTYENKRHYYSTILVEEKCVLDVYYFCTIRFLFVQHRIISAMLLQVGIISWKAESTSLQLPPPSFVFPCLVNCPR